MIEHQEVIEAVTVPIHYHRSSPPLCKKRLSFRPHPSPLEYGLFLLPFHFNRLRSRKLGNFAGTNVSIPHNFAENGIHDEVRQSVVIPVCHRLRGITPLAFTRALNGTVGAGHDTQRLAAGLKGF